MGDYDDGGAITEVLSPPEEPSGADIQQMVQEAGWQVAAVDWIFTKVTGESIVEKVIMPITGDFRKIAQDGESWDKVGEAMSTLADTLVSNVNAVRQNWDGAAAVKHELYVQAGWRAGLFVEGQVAKLIAKGFNSVAEGSQRLCAKALDLLKTLVNKLIDAIAKIWIPAAGWIRAAQLVWDAYQLYQKIMSIIDAVKDIIERCKALWESVQNIGGQLAKLKDARSIGDVVDIATGISDEVGNIKDNVQGIKDDATDIAANAREASGDARDVYNRSKDLPKDLKDGWNETRENWDEQKQRIRDAPGQAWDAARDGAHNALDNARAGARNAVDSLRDGSAWDAARQGVRDGASGALGAARDGVTSYGQDLYQEHIGQHVDQVRQTADMARSGVEHARNMPSYAGDLRDGISQGWTSARDGVDGFRQDPGGAVRDAGAAATRGVVGEQGVQDLRETRDNMRGLAGDLREDAGRVRDRVTNWWQNR
ncbi:hypothetical protein [Goodfellowiella coeruleoviolacea]|uniref:WXG100 family type VII secretion target n=1 Tax=Goodfellowiella coeruleoviolacea TaxID=334858 RepID=A0AAE3KGA8_9PSEU|nr:hypothetical protein [Goodfellowiella coeruleoviolacea]MCP2165950.1 hypothetical protein [Goodfellowiella coeruleoviolacea]